MASAFERLGSISPTRFCKSALLVPEEGIGSSFEDLSPNDLFFFFGSLWLKVKDILSVVPPPSSSQALSVKYLPVKKRESCDRGSLPAQRLTNHKLHQGQNAYSETEETGQSQDLVITLDEHGLTV
jgi:hypothetical protein